jgi:hypothetical protein
MLGTPRLARLLGGCADDSELIAALLAELGAFTRRRLGSRTRTSLLLAVERSGAGEHMPVATGAGRSLGS